jgi:glucokinase
MSPMNWSHPERDCHPSMKRFARSTAVRSKIVSPAGMRERADAGDEMYLQLILVRACAVMGAVGDLALANGALGGVVLAGGVTERIVDFLRMPEAADRFRARGPMSEFLENCPVVLMHDPEAPLIGAAAYYDQELRK